MVFIPGQNRRATGNFCGCLDSTTDFSKWEDYWVEYNIGTSRQGEASERKAFHVFLEPDLALCRRQGALGPVAEQIDGASFQAHRLQLIAGTSPSYSRMIEGEPQVSVPLLPR